MMDTDWLRAEVQTPAQDPERGQTRQRALTEALRRAILQGRLATGTRLPASRTLAVDLGLARNTVLYAYEQLSAEGYLQPSRHGTRVAPLALAPAAQTGAGAVWPALSQRAQAALRPEAGGEQGLLPLALGVPDVASFPIRAWRASLDSAWRQASARHLGYAPQGGEPALRQALAAYLSGVHGVAVEAAQVVITAGTQSSLDLCARLLADAGDTAWVEDPGYPAARTAFQLAGLRLHGVAVDDAGLAPTPADWQVHPPRLVFVTPSHQFPTGAVLTLARRLALIEQAQAAGAWIIEDDYESEFRPDQSVEQLALADFIHRDRYTIHLHCMRRLYAERRAALERNFPEGWVTGGEAGLHLMLWWPDPIPSAAVVARAAQAQGIAARPLSRYTLAPPQAQALALGLGATALPLIEGAVQRLREIWGYAKAS